MQITRGYGTAVAVIAISGGLAVTAVTATAESRKVKLVANGLYVGSTTQDVFPEKGVFGHGTMKIHLDSSKVRINGLSLSWVCPGDDYQRRTTVKVGDEEFEFDKIRFKKGTRAFSWRGDVPWYISEPEAPEVLEGTANMRIDGRIHRKKPRTPKDGFPSPRSSFSVGYGSVTMRDGDCTSKIRWEIEKGDSEPIANL